MNSNFEIRAAVEVRASGRRLEGYAAVFDQETRIADFTELVRPGAFKDSLGGDVLGLVDHDTSKLLARTKSGTLRLAEDSKGLHFDLAIPDTSLGRDVVALAERGDLGGASFAFTVPQGGERWTGRSRELVLVNLQEISVVSAWPAYEGTSVMARSRMPLRLAMARRFMETC